MSLASMRFKCDWPECESAMVVVHAMQLFNAGWEDRELSSHCMYSKHVCRLHRDKSAADLAAARGDLPISQERREGR